RMHGGVIDNQSFHCPPYGISPRCHTLGFRCFSASFLCISILLCSFSLFKSAQWAAIMAQILGYLALHAFSLGKYSKCFLFMAVSTPYSFDVGVPLKSKNIPSGDL